MSANAEQLVIGVLVALAALYLSKQLYSHFKKLKGLSSSKKAGGCGCSDSSSECH